MKKITVIVEKGDDGGFSVYSPEVMGVYAPGPTEQEAMEEFMEMLGEAAEDYYDRNGEYPEWYEGTVE